MNIYNTCATYSSTYTVPIPYACRSMVKSRKKQHLCIHVTYTGTYIYVHAYTNMNTYAYAWTCTCTCLLPVLCLPICTVYCLLIEWCLPTCMMFAHLYYVRLPVLCPLTWILSAVPHEFCLPLLRLPSCIMSAYVYDVFLPFDVCLPVVCLPACTGSVADPDPGSGTFLTPGSGIWNRFFPDPGSRIRPLFLRA